MRFLLLYFRYLRLLGLCSIPHGCFKAGDLLFFPLHIGVFAADFQRLDHEANPGVHHEVLHRWSAVDADTDHRADHMKKLVGVVAGDPVYLAELDLVSQLDLVGRLEWRP